MRAPRARPANRPGWQTSRIGATGSVVVAPAVSVDLECLLVRLGERVPRFVEPMLLSAAAAPPAEDGWALEVKWDGIRAQALIDGGRLTVRSRRGRDCTSEFPELAVQLPGRRREADAAARW